MRTTVGLVLLAVIGGCGPYDEALGAPPGAVEDASSGSGARGDAETVAGESSSGDPSTFLSAPDAGDLFRCDLWAQDCPAGTKCSPWASDGGTWNALKCTPIDPDPDAVDEPCTVVGHPASGVDSCVVGAMCWDVDRETNTGVCVAHCQGDANNPTCADPRTRCGGPRNFPLCLEMCCPVEQDCPLGQGCYPTTSTFSCAPDAGGDTGGLGSPCAFVNACDAGMLCADPSRVPGCHSAGSCCTSYCVVGSSECGLLHPAMECVPWFEEGHAPPGLELTGACFLPD